MASNKESYSLFKSAVALLLIAGCLIASQWQFQRGADRQARNDLVEAQTALPAISLMDVIGSPISSLSTFEWREVTAIGSFDATRQILLRNRYFEGKYGFQVLTAFTANSGEKFWVDRGWVQAADTAIEQPEISPLPVGDVTINGRIRLDTSLPQGNFFALPAIGKGLISEANAQSSNTEVGLQSPFYIDLVSGSTPLLTPEVPAELPPLNDGPHYAYAVQWVLFGALVVYGRYLIRREVLPGKKVSVKS